MQDSHQITLTTLFAVAMLIFGSGQAIALIDVQPGPILESETDLYVCDIAPDGSYAAVGGQSSRYVRIYKTSTGTLVGTATLPAGVETEDVELSIGGGVFVGGQNSGAYRFNEYGSLIWSRTDILGENCIAVTDSGNLAFTVGRNPVDSSRQFYRLNGSTGADLIAPVTINTRGWSVWEVETTADGGRVLLMTNSDIIITDGFGTETHFYDIAADNSLHFAALSPDGTHFVVSYRDPADSTLKVSLYEIGVGEKWTKQIGSYSGVCMDSHNRVYVSTLYHETIIYNITGSEITRWNDRARWIDVTSDGNCCVMGENSTNANTTLYNLADVYNCYPDLHMQAYITDVVPYDADTLKYTLTIANWYNVPPDLFVPSPELPACGLNDQAGRTYLRIKGNNGTSYFNGCGAWGDGISSEFLKNLSVYVDNDQPLDPYIYLELWDRKCNQYLYSTYAYTGNPCPVGDIDGDCIVNLRDFTLMAENWMMDNN